VEIRRAKDLGESTTIKAAKQSDVFAIGLAAAGFVCCAGWFVTPQAIKDKLTPIALAGFGGVGFVFKMKLVQIKDGRLAIGDLDNAIENYALLKPEDGHRLAEVGEYVAGRKPISEMPIVKEAINAQVAQQVSAHINNLERAAATKPSNAEELIQGLHSKIDSFSRPTAEVAKTNQVPLPPVAISRNVDLNALANEVSTL
jgi:hypothetical protein